VISRRVFCSITLAASALGDGQAVNGDSFPSWNAGAATNALITFLSSTADPTTSMFLPIEERIVTFDLDGALMVEHPVYAQLAFMLDRVPALIAARPELKDKEPFKTALSGDMEAVTKLSLRDLEQIVVATSTGMTVDTFAVEAARWLTGARHPRWNQPYTSLVYQPMLELLAAFRDAGYKIYIATGGGQDFVRLYSDRVLGIPREQVIGTPGKITYTLNAQGEPVLTNDSKSLLNNNDAHKPEGIHLMIGRRPRAAVGNSIGDRPMLEYATIGQQPSLGMLVLHDDAEREYAYGPAEGLPDTQFGTFTQVLYDDAMRHGWVVISMKRDWKRMFLFDGT